MSTTPRTLAALTLALGLVALSCGGQSERDDEVWPGAPVVLISIDTLRADRLPVYGYDKVDTPNFDALRADGVLFERAFTHVPLTLPSHASIFTGLLPSEHGIRDNQGYELDAANLPLLQRTLREAGYATGAAVSSAVLLGGSGFDTDFDVYDDEIRYPDRSVGLGGLVRPGDETLEAIVPWLREVSDRPFLLFFHIYEPHAPYDPPEPYASRYGSAYDGEVAWSDRIVGDLLDELRELGVYDRAAIVLLSDHGEGLEEHDERTHGVYLYNSTLQVPLIVKLPGSARAGTSVSEPVQLADVFPTLASLVGVEPPGGLTGRPLLGESVSIDPDRTIYSETYFPRLQYGWNELLSVIEGPYHYVDGPEPELFDLEEDPGETRNIVADLPDVREDLRRRVEEFRTELVPPGEVDPETRERLAALGYVGGADLSDEGPLPDPRDRKGALRDIEAAYAHFHAAEYEEAAALYARVLQDNPKVQAAWVQLARSLIKLGRRDEALEVCVRGLVQTPRSDALLLTAAKLYFEKGRLEEARDHAVLVEGSTERDAAVLLGQIAVHRGDVDEAERQARLAGEAGARGEFQDMLLAEVHVARRQYDEALVLVRGIEEALSTGTETNPMVRDGRGLESPPKGLYYVKGESLANLGRNEEAVMAFLREIELFPDELRAYTHLSVLLMVMGRTEQAHRALQAMLDANPDPLAYAEAVRTLRVVGDHRTADLVLRNARSRFPGDETLGNL
jgi:arylsulfatase A-like enzyme/tetratricopeptide (TPR) repeat protein